MGWLILERLFELLALFSWLDIILALAAVLAATSIQVGAGIAFGVVAGPLLALIDVKFVPVPVLMLTFLTATSASWGEREGIVWPEVRSAISGRVAGSIVGAFILTMITDEKTFMLVFGLIIAFVVLISLSGFRIPFNLVSVGLAGLVSGFTASITSVGGPPMAVVYQNRSSREARPTLQTYFSFGAFATIMVLTVGGQVKLDDFLLAFLLLPALLGGFVVGPRLKPFFDRSFRTFMLLVAAAAAAMLIYRGLA